MKILWSSLFLIAVTALAQAQSPKLDPLETGRQYTAWFYAGETGRLWELFSPEMKQAIGSAEKLKAFRDQVGDQLGTETAVVDEKVEPSGLYQVYTRKARFSKSPDRRFVTLWTLNGKGTIAGFFIRPDTSTEAPSSHLDYQTKTPLRLPFDGEWFVFWGGRTVAQNYHAAYPDQRFAYDLLVMRDGKSHTGDGTRRAVLLLRPAHPGSRGRHRGRGDGRPFRQ